MSDSTRTRERMGHGSFMISRSLGRTTTTVRGYVCQLDLTLQYNTKPTQVHRLIWQRFVERRIYIHGESATSKWVKARGNPGNGT
jgi:hypothetical protein